MQSDVHEARAGAMSIMAKQYGAKSTSPERRQELYDLYLRRHDRIDSWDLVDLAAHHVIGPHLLERDRTVLRRLASSDNPWERRTAIVATFAFIRAGELDDTFSLAESLLGERTDLVQKAVGWALRTAGGPRLIAFLEANAAAMPRPMLRNAIEKFEPKARQRYLCMGRQS
jgi:3-methyladenine DNA glycosylase AlkD